MTVLPDGLWGAVEYQESRNRPGVLGQPTRYGIPQGDSQMLPATAQEMAAKLGVPWQPSLMTGTDPQAANYQSTLGQAYLQQGYDATGNPRDALRYYYGGPNRSMWGPKTNAYADQVLSRWNNQPQTGDPPQGPYYSSGGQSPMPLSMPSMPPARPLTSPNQGQNAPLASLGALANAPMSTDLPTAAEAFSPHGSSGNPASLGALANPPQVRGPSKFNLGNILGVVGDAFSAYGGRQPTFGPFLQQEHMLQQQQDFEREKYNNELRIRMAMMLNPGIDTDIGHKLIGAGIMPGTPQWTSAMGTSAANDLDPTVNTSYGPVLRSSVVHSLQPPQAAIARLRQELAAGNQSAIGQFDEMYGPGASIRWGASH